MVKEQMGLGPVKLHWPAAVSEKVEAKQAGLEISQTLLMRVQFVIVNFSRVMDKNSHRLVTL